jgi:O-acetyl-ADP-ribose deacetylase (regulator of RNase III)
MYIQVIEGDILDQPVEVIVNPWNRNMIPWWLLLPQGVSGSIKKHAGYEPFKELGKKGVIPLGGAVITNAGRLPFKAIIHVAGINMLWVSSCSSVTDSVRNAMKIVIEKEFKSVAFPLIGGGTGGSKQDKVLSWMQNTFSLINYNGIVKIVLFNKK